MPGSACFAALLLSCFAAFLLCCFAAFLLSCLPSPRPFFPVVMHLADKNKVVVEFTWKVHVGFISRSRREKIGLYAVGTKNRPIMVKDVFRILG
ncbi:MAG: hypothetical protein ACTSUE_18300 [Promethearchaeota archaeon]